MTERLHLEFSIGSIDPISGDRQISDLIKKHEGDFEPYFSRLIDIEDARYTVIPNSLILNEVLINGSQGSAHGSFSWNFYAGCRDLNSTDEDEVSLEFEIVGDRIIFDIELPPIWRTDD